MQGSAGFRSPCGCCVKKCSAWPSGQSTNRHPPGTQPQRCDGRETELYRLDAADKLHEDAPGKDPEIVFSIGRLAGLASRAAFQFRESIPGSLPGHRGREDIRFPTNPPMRPEDAA